MKFIKKYSTLISIIFLIGTSIITHLEWFNPTSILAEGDWIYWPKMAIQDVFRGNNTWYSFFNIGSPNITINFNFFMALLHIFLKLGLSPDQAQKLTIFIPTVILGFLSPYFLFRFVSKNDLIAVVISLFYGSTSYLLLRQTVHLPLAFVYSLAPLVLHLFIKCVNNNTFKSWLSFSLIYSLSLFFEIRITFLVSLMLALYFFLIPRKKISSYILNIFCFLVAIIGLNSFWIFPTILSSSTVSEINATTTRGLFGDNLFNLINALSLHEAVWTGSLPSLDFAVPSLPHLWIIPFLAILSLLSIRHLSKEKHNLLYFFWAIALLGIFFTKQSHHPFPWAYLYLYSHLPGFNLFREASKWYLLTALGYAGILTLLLVAAKKGYSRSFYYASILLISIVVFINLSPTVSKRIGGTFKSRHMPSGFANLNKDINDDQSFYRVLWIPSAPKWATFTSSHPRMDLNSLISTDWRFAYKKEDTFWTYNNNFIEKLLHARNFRNLLNISSVKYIIVPYVYSSTDDLFFNKDIKREHLIRTLDKTTYLKKIKSPYFNIYLNPNYRSHIYASNEIETINKSIIPQNIKYNRINATFFSVSITNLARPLFLNFSEKYAKDWLLYVGNSGHTLPSKYHFKNNANLNSYIIHPEYIKHNLDSSLYKVNKNGSLDITVFIYYKPQDYFQIGSIISVSVFVLIIVYFGINIYYEKNRKK